jgi:hypothetical protein
VAYEIRYIVWEKVFTRMPDPTSVGSRVFSSVWINLEGETKQVTGPFVKHALSYSCNISFCGGFVLGYVISAPVILQTLIRKRVGFIYKRVSHPPGLRR